MSDKDNPQDVIDSYRKRQERAQRTHVILFVLFSLLVIFCGGLLIFWLTGADTSAISMDMLKAVCMAGLSDVATITSSSW